MDSRASEREKGVFASIPETDGNRMVSLHTLREHHHGAGVNWSTQDGKCNPVSRFYRQLEVISACDSDSAIKVKDKRMYCASNDGSLISVDAGRALTPPSLEYYKFLKFLDVTKIENNGSIVIYLDEEKRDILKERGIEIIPVDKENHQYSALFEDVHGGRFYDRIDTVLAVPLPVLLYEMACFTKIYLPESIRNTNAEKEEYIGHEAEDDDDDKYYKELVNFLEMQIQSLQHELESVDALVQLLKPGRDQAIEQMKTHEVSGESPKRVFVSNTAGMLFHHSPLTDHSSTVPDEKITPTGNKP